MMRPWARLFAGVLLFGSSLLCAAQSAQFDVRQFGARCDWNGAKGTDDTAAFRAAARAAVKAYAADGRAQVVTFRGECMLAGEVAFGSGVHWLGQGIIIVPQQKGFTLHAVNADDVAWDHVHIKVLKAGTAGAADSAISWFSINDAGPRRRVAIRGCVIENSDWGIFVLYNNGAGSLDDVEIADTTVTSDAVYTNGDGIHVAGRVSGIRIHDNRIANRGDAGIGLTSESPSGQGKVYVLSGARVWNNVLTNDLVGLDDSGATNVEWTANTVKATVARKGAQNPAFRQIWYGGAYPVGVRTTGNSFESGDNGGVSAAVKIDPKVAGQTSWPDLHSVFENNTIDGPNAPLYVRGRNLVISGNTFARGGTVTLDYDGAGGLATETVVLGPNTWLADGTVAAGAGCALYKNVRVEPQRESGGKVAYKNRGCMGEAR
jgi:hypothetical protein